MTAAAASADRSTPAGLPARQAALAALYAVETQGRALDAGLSATFRRLALEPRDRAFAYLLASTVLRRQGWIDRVLDQYLKKPPQLEVRIALRLGVAQLLFLGSPPHAAVGLSVEAMKADRDTARAAGLANAVLRKIAQAGPSALRGFRPSEALPDWLARRWNATYGPQTADAMAQAGFAEPPLDLTVKRDPSFWAAQLGGRVLPNGAVRLDEIGDVTSLPGYADGEWWVQDAAAALPATLLGPVRGRMVADLCAAPGGKTAQLAAAGARVTAVDVSGKRLERLKTNLDRLTLSAEAVAADATQWRPERPFDAVLLDAPCSATGTLRRRPDAAWTRDPDAIGALAPVQTALLNAAADMLAPGGTLVFCTCSLEPEEGPSIVARALAAGAPIVPDPIRPAEIPGLEPALLADGTLRTRPDHWAEHGGVDGFFIARFRRRDLFSAGLNP
ncbi:MAG: RsmB/NOP family class I SAM-dependent RNA methyltransferase [Maricaulaceae bacterium]